MWCLELVEGDSVYELTPGKTHTVSRKVGDIVLANDVSVSRKHAFLAVKCPITDGVSLWDESSKYGTFVNKGIDDSKRIEKNLKVTIKDGGLVRFGLQNNVWRLKRFPPCVCLHMLKPDDKKNVKSVISQLGGKVVENWSKDPSYLVTSSVRLTFEVMCALVSGKHIVTPQFWNSLMNAGNETPGDPSKFVPPLLDKRLSNNSSLCLPNTARKSLFKDKLFIFPNSKSFNVFKGLIELAGGKAEKISECHMPLSDYCKPHVAVLNCSENDQTSFFNKVLSTLIQNNLRVIHEEEIGLAIWKVSTARHCNPRQTLTKAPADFLRLSRQSEMDIGNILVENTEDIAATATGPVSTDMVIPPSFSDNNLHSSEDNTMSMSVLIAPKPSIPASSAGPTRKRSRGNSSDRADTKSVDIKVEPDSAGEEDLFADEVPAKKLCVTGKMKKRHIEDSDEEFLLPSPPKKRNKQKAVKDDDCDLFDLPEEPQSLRENKRDNDDDDDDVELDFLEKSSRFNKSSKVSTHNQSRDLFETQEPSGAASTSNGKRKERGDSDQEVPPPKRAPKDVTNTLETKPTQTVKLNFVKKEARDSEHVNDVNDELSSQFHSNVIVTKLVKRDLSKSTIESVNGRNNTTNSTKPNFKKFRKNWPVSTSSERRLITTVVQSSRGRSSNGDSEDDEDSFLPSRPINRQNNASINDDDDDDDEFALPSFSQV